MSARDQVVYLQEVPAHNFLHGCIAQHTITDRSSMQHCKALHEAVAAAITTLQVLT